MKIGDKVKLIKLNGGEMYGAHIGMSGVILKHDYGDRWYAQCRDFRKVQQGIMGAYVAPDEYWELIKVKETKVSKFYRVLKDSPAWEAGAILERDGNNYKAISDLWNTDAAEKCTNYVESYNIIENSPEWFERVYEVKVLGKAKYLAKEAAKAAHNKLVKK